MRRQPRLDAPDVLHHVMVRGLERRTIFLDDTDRADFVARVARLAERGALTVYAWALLPNHAHLSVRAGNRPIARSIRALLTGYAGAFNRRHHRVGHLFRIRNAPCDAHVNQRSQPRRHRRHAGTSWT
jgi:REP element-mobilizing transposase RayT